MPTFGTDHPRPVLVQYTYRLGLVCSGVPVDYDVLKRRPLTLYAAAMQVATDTRIVAREPIRHVDSLSKSGNPRALKQTLVVEPLLMDRKGCRV